jgi:hypothetical protein
MQQLLVIEEDKLDEISLDKQSKSAKALQLVAQGTPVEAIADEFEITFEAAVLLSVGGKLLAKCFFFGFVFFKDFTLFKRSVFA